MVVISFTLDDCRSLESIGWISSNFPPRRGTVESIQTSLPGRTDTPTTTTAAAPVSQTQVMSSDNRLAPSSPAPSP
jgi:hypothetical protein